jgi:hypothetical protein
MVGDYRRKNNNNPKLLASFYFVSPNFKIASSEKNHACLVFLWFGFVM